LTEKQQKKSTPTVAELAPQQVQNDEENAGTTAPLLGRKDLAV
jgi:hypothetical protein